MNAEASGFFRFGIFCPEGLDGHAADALVIQRTVTVIGISLSDPVYDVHSFDYFAERGIASVEMRGSLMHDEEL